MTKKPPITAQRRQLLERERDRSRRIVAAITEILDLFTADTGLPPIPLPAELNGWTQLRYQIGKIGKAIESELGTVEGEKAKGD